MKKRMWLASGMVAASLGLGLAAPVLGASPWEGGGGGFFGGGRGGGGGGGGGGEEPVEEAGNNLSFPVIWGDNYAGVTLRGTELTAQLNGASVSLDGDVWYLQQDEDNTWQAQNDLNASYLDVSEIDWGDNLESQDWTTSSVIRVETRLFQNLTTAMQGYEMSYLSGSGPDEMWGSNGDLYDSNIATVYSQCARLTIQKIGTGALTWNPATDQWDGDANAPLFNGGVWEGGDGPGFYSPEVNVSGTLVYGYVWQAQSMNDGAGKYRITFSLEDSGACPNTLLTHFDTTTVATATNNQAYVDAANDLSYIDIDLNSGRGRRPATGGGGSGGWGR